VETAIRSILAHAILTVMTDDDDDDDFDELLVTVTGAIEDDFTRKKHDSSTV